MTAPAPIELPVEVAQTAELYRLSGMVDAVRDTARELLSHAVAPTTANRLAGRYNRLREEIAATLTPASATRLLDWTDQLNTETATVDEVFDAATTASRWVDLVIGLPSYLVARQVSEAEMADVLTRLPDNTRPVHGAADKPGQYL